MALTLTNISTLSLLNALNRTTLAQASTLLRLSTGRKINHGKDDPAGLLAWQGLETELTAVNAALASNQRTDAMLGVADGALGEVLDLLDEIQTLAQASSSSAGLTASELAANQAQIDDAIASIDRIIRTTQFNGQRLLDGSLGINVSGGTGLTNIQVYSLDPNAGDYAISVRVNAAAERAATGGSENLMNNSASEATTISIQGKLGTQVIEIAAGENLSAVLAQINDATGLTGVVASQTSATAAIHLRSQGYGSDAFVKVSVLEGGATYGSGSVNTVNEEGVDADVSVNGQATGAQGKEVFYNANGLSLSFTLTDTTNAAGQTASFTADNDGGAMFQLGTDALTRVTLGIDGLWSQRLGTGEVGEVLSSLKSGGAHDLLSDPAKAAEIAAAAASQVATLQGRIGGFQNYQVQSSLNAMGAMREGLSSAQSSIMDVDYAFETAALNRQNVLIQAAISLLGLANQQCAQVLSLLA